MTGMKNCEYCGGQGKRIGPSGKKETCSVCKGRGLVLDVRPKY